MTITRPTTNVVARTVIALLFLLPEVQAQWLTDYCYRKSLTIQASEVSGSTDLVNFPVLISMTDNDLRTVGNGGNVTSALGNDIRITDDANNELDIDLQSYNPATGQLTLWANVPLVDHDDNTSLFLYYGNGTATPYPAPTDTWDGNFAAVWHLEEPTGQQVLDATSNDMDETVDGMGRPFTDTYGGNTTTTTISGVIGSARSFNNEGNNAGDFGFIEIPHTTGNPLDITGTQVTIEVWARMYFPAPSDAPFVVKGRGTNLESFMLGVDGGPNEVNRRITSSTADGFDGFEFGDVCDDDGHYRYDDPATVDADWHHFAMVYDGSNLDGSQVTNLKTFVDGALIPFDESAACARPYPYGNMTSSDGGAFEDLFIGRRIGSNRMFKGAMDEVRISNVARSDGWVTTSYNTVNNTSSFYLVGAEEYPLEGGAISTPRANLDQGESATITLTDFDATASLQWQSSTDNSIFSDIMGETSSTLTTAALAETTYFRVKSTRDGCDAFSNIQTLNVRKSTFVGDYIFRTLIVIDHIKVECSTPLSDFPVLVRFDGATDLLTTTGKIQSTDGYDIFFTDLANNPLDFELERYDGVQGDLVAWVKTDLKCNADSEFFMYFGDCTPPVVDPSTPATWSNGYDGVYHLDEDPSAGTATDASGNGNDGMPSGFGGDNRVVGQIGLGIELDGNDDYVDFGTTPQISGTADRTYEAWIQIQDFTPDDGVFQAGPPGGNDFSLHAQNNVDNNFEVQRDNQDDEFTFNAALNNWRHVALAYDNTAEETSVYYEGELFDVFSGAINTGVDDLELGRYNNQEFEGFMDEFRISSVARSSEWIKTEFNNQSDPSSFFSSDISESNIVWTGANDTDWNDIGNWSSCFLPTPGDDVIIPGGLMNYPLLDQDRTVGFLSIGAGADVALGTFELTALGDISNSGTLTANTGSVRMAGSVDQYIRGASATTFHDLVVDKGSGELILDQDVIVDNDLTFAQGFVRLNGRELIIGSSGQINGADMSRFFISDENSCLTQRGLGTGSRTGDILFPIGTAVTSYTPVTLNNVGTADDFCVFVCDQVFEEGTCSGTLIDMGVVDKTWNVTPVNGLGLDVTLQLQWNGTDEGAGFDRLDAPFISRHSGTQWNARASGPLGGTDPYTLSTSGLSNFSPFAIGSGSSLLPVEYSALRAYAAEDEVVLEWSTASEENNDRFLIERSSGQDDFVVIGEVQGAGDAQTTQDYLFRDEAPMPGLNLYRLRQIDFDGGFELSRVLVVHFVPNTEGSILLYPNPALDRVTVDRSEVPTGLVELHVVDMTGRLMLERVLKDSQATSLDFSTWRRGQYVFIFKGATYEQRFLFVLR